MRTPSGMRMCTHFIIASCQNSWEVSGLFQHLQFCKHFESRTSPEPCWGYFIGRLAGHVTRQGETNGRMDKRGHTMGCWVSLGLLGYLNYSKIVYRYFIMQNISTGAGKLWKRQNNQAPLYISWHFNLGKLCRKWCSCLRKWTRVKHMKYGWKLNYSFWSLDIHPKMNDIIFLLILLLPLS